jgi:hypothetical protein
MPDNKISEFWSPGHYLSNRQREARHAQEAKTYPEPSWEERFAAMPAMASTPAPKPAPHPDHRPSGTWDK